MSEAQAVNPFDPWAWAWQAGSKKLAFGINVFLPECLPKPMSQFWFEVDNMFSVCCAPFGQSMHQTQIASFPRWAWWTSQSTTSKLARLPRDKYHFIKFFRDDWQQKRFRTENSWTEKGFMYWAVAHLLIWRCIELHPMLTEPVFT